MSIYKKDKNKLLANPRIITIIGLLVVILIAVPLIKNFNQRRKINKEIKELEEEIKTVGNKNSDLEKLISYLGSNEFAEEQARLNFGLKKAGEEVLVIKEAGTGTTSAPGASAAADKNSTKPTNNPQRWWKYFFE